MLKKCTACSLEKEETTDFYWHKGNQKYRTICKPCHGIRYKRTKAQIHRRSPEAWARELEKQREWRKNNRPKMREYENRALKVRPSLRAYRKRWVKENKEQFLLLKKVNGQRRRARKANNGGKHTVAEWVALVRECGNKCLCCWQAGNEHTLEQDHIIPIALGGPDNIDNIQPLCGPCNASKKAKAIDYRSNRFAPMFEANPEWLTMPPGDEL